MVLRQGLGSWAEIWYRTRGAKAFAWDWERGLDSCWGLVNQVGWELGLGLGAWYKSCSKSWPDLWDLIPEMELRLGAVAGQGLKCGQPPRLDTNTPYFLMTCPVTLLVSFLGFSLPVKQQWFLQDTDYGRCFA